MTNDNNKPATTQHKSLFADKALQDEPVIINTNAENIIDNGVDKCIDKNHGNTRCEIKQNGYCI